MLDRYPTDKFGFILSKDDVVILPKGKGEESGYGYVEEVVSKRSVRIKVDELSVDKYGALLIIQARKVINLSWRHILEKISNPVKNNFAEFDIIFRNYRYKSPVIKKRIRDLNKEFEHELKILQRQISDQSIKLLKLSFELKEHQNILEVGDVVIWQDIMAKIWDPVLCKIIETGLHPLYSVFTKKMKLGKRQYYRYDMEFDIIYHFTETEFYRIKMENKLKTPQEFIDFVNSNFKHFEE